MRVKVEFDGNNYISQMVTDYIDGNFEVGDDFDFEHFNCYHLVNGDLVLDESKKADEITNESNEAEIANLQKDLNDTDYICARCFEEIMALNKPLTFIADMIAILVKYSAQYKTVLQQRKQWRARIEELRDETE